MRRPSLLRLHACLSAQALQLEAERCKIERIDEGIEKADRIIFRDTVIEALWQEDHLVTLRALDMTHNRTKLQERGSK
jgi:hypothetical protein